MLVLVVAWRPAAHGVAPARELAVVVRGEALGVRARDVPLAEVLAAVAAATGAALRGQVQGDRRLTVEFDPVPLADALPRLLADGSFTLRFGAAGRLVAIELRGGPAPPGQHPAAPSPAAALLAAIQAHAPVPVDGRLAALFGSDRLTLAQLADAALRETDAGVRAQAMEAALRAIEGDADLGPRLLASFDATNDGEVGGALRAVAGPRAEELAAFVATRAAGAALRAHAAGVLRGLRADGGG